MRRQRHKISYIRKPFARKSLVCLPLAAVALAMGVISVSLSVRLQGRGELNVAAWGVSSFLFAVMALAYGGLSFLEKEKNYLLSRIGMWMSGALIVLWFCVMVVGVIGD